MSINYWIEIESVHTQIYSTKDFITEKVSKFIYLVILHNLYFIWYLSVATNHLLN